MEVKEKTLDANEKKERILQFQKEYKEIHNIDVSKKSKEWLAKNPEYKKAWIAFNTNKNLKKDFTVPEVVEVAPSVIDKSLVEIAFLKEQLAQMQEELAKKVVPVEAPRPVPEIVGNTKSKKDKKNNKKEKSKEGKIGKDKKDKKKKKDK